MAKRPRFGGNDDARMLAAPGARLHDLWRTVRIWREFVRGFRAFRDLGPTVTVFGSARFGEEHPYYALARETGRELGRAGYAVMTGGGPGIMEVANRGARDVGALSIGCNIELPHEQVPNLYLDRWEDFHYFFVRKVMLVKHSCAFVALPGGFGTLDEIFEVGTLIQTGTIGDFPVVAMGTAYRQGVRDFTRGTMLEAGTIAATDLDYFSHTDDPQEAVALIHRVSPAA